jgi:hypothetical protein
MYCKADLGAIKQKPDQKEQEEKQSIEKQKTLEFFNRGQIYIENRLKSTKYYKTTTEQIKNTPAIEEWTDIFEIEMPFESSLKRSNEEVRKEMTQYSLLVDEEDKKKSREATGVKHTPFVELEYYDPVDSCCLDIMHNLFLGIMKRYVGFLRNLVKALKKTATNRNLEIADLWMKLAHIPHDIGRMPTKWTGKLGYFKAIEWMNMISIFAIPILTAVGIDSLYIVPLIPLQQVAFTLRKQVISEDEIIKVDQNVRLFYSFSLYALSTGFNCPNLHLLLHLPALLRLYGPPCNWWSYPYERFLNNVNQYARNESNVEASMMRSWVSHAASIEKLERLRNDALSIENSSGDSLDHLPTSQFIQERIGVLVGSDTNQLLNHSPVLRLKINRQGRTSGLIYHSSKRMYHQMLEWISKHEVLVKGTEEIPFFPKDNVDRLSRQSFSLDQGWNCSKQNGIAPVSAPPSVKCISKGLLEQYYCSKYGDKGWNVKDSDLIQVYKEVRLCGETHSSKWAGGSNGFIAALFYDQKCRTTYPWFAQVCFYFSHDLQVSSAEKELPVKHHFAFVTWYDQPKPDEIKLESWRSKDFFFEKQKQSSTKSKAKKNEMQREEQFVQEDIDTDVKHNDRLLLQARTNELASKHIFEKQNEYQLQLAHILLDRLRQDFPLISSQPHPDSLDSAISVDHNRILPIARIFGRVAVGPAASNNLKVVMHIPNKRHG